MLYNNRHERFAQGIAQGKPATRAYIDAGYKARGHSAEAAAARLLRKSEVTERIEALAEKLAKTAIANADEIQTFLTSVLRGKDENGKDITEQQMTRDGTIVTLKASVRDRLKAAELLARARGLFTQSSDAGDGELDAIAEALARPRSVN